MNILESTIAALDRNGIAALHVARASDVVPTLARIMDKGASVAVGGSQSLFECGAIDFLRGGDYTFYDRYAADASDDVYTQSFGADYLLCSANAVTQNGEIYNVDGRSNRVAAIAFGPKRVIMVVSTNKIVPDLDAAVERVKTIAAPKNAKRLSCKTPCATTGKCISLERESHGMTDGCYSPARICCNYVVSAYQRERGRITVIFVDEPLGF